jgi:hypothetical protein
MPATYDQYLPNALLAAVSLNYQIANETQGIRAVNSANSGRCGGCDGIDNDVMSF